MGWVAIIKNKKRWLSLAREMLAAPMPRWCTLLVGGQWFRNYGTSSP